MTLYMLVTKDKYELPLAVAESATELAKMISVSRNRILSAISHAEKNGYRSIYVKVECE